MSSLPIHPAPPCRRVQTFLRTVASLVGIAGLISLLGEAFLVYALLSAPVSSHEDEIFYSALVAFYLAFIIPFIPFSIWALWIAWAVWFRMKPAAVRALSAWCCLAGGFLALWSISWLESLLPIQSRGALISVALLILLVAVPSVYLQTSRRLVSRLFPQPEPNIQPTCTLT